MTVLPIRPLARSSTISRISPSRSCAISSRRSCAGVVLVERRCRSCGLNIRSWPREVLPDRSGDGEAGAVGAAEHVDDVGDDRGDDPHVVDRQVAVRGAGRRRAEVGGADAHGEDAVAVLVEQPRRPAARRPGSRVQHRRRTRAPASRSSRRPAARSAVVERVEVAAPVAAVNFGSTNPSSSCAARRRAARTSAAICSGARTRTNSSGSSPCAAAAQRGQRDSTRLASRLGDLARRRSRPPGTPRRDVTPAAACLAMSATSAGGSPGM